MPGLPSLLLLFARPLHLHPRGLCPDVTGRGPPGPPVRTGCTPGWLAPFTSISVLPAQHASRPMSSSYWHWRVASAGAGTRWGQGLGVGPLCLRLSPRACVQHSSPSAGINERGSEGVLQSRARREGPRHPFPWGWGAWMRAGDTVGALWASWARPPACPEQHPGCDGSSLQLLPLQVPSTLALLV